MLQKLVINNIALIKRLELDFCDKLNVLSGETGAGKSIIVDGLMLLLGNRYDKSLLRFNESSGFVEGVFTAAGAAKAALREIGADEDELVIINRKFLADGRNEIRINGRLCTTSMLKAVSSCLVDIYGQNDSYALTRQTEHLRILDFYVRQTAEPLKAEIAAKLAELKKVSSALADLGDAAERARNVDLLNYQIEEIEAAAIGKNEEDELIAKRRKANCAEKISSALSETIRLLSEDSDATAISLVDEAVRQTEDITEFGDGFAELARRLESVSIELGDIAECAAQELGNIEFDFSFLDKLEQRLEVVRGLKRKYGEYDKMAAYLNEAKDRLYTLEHCDEEYERLTKKHDELVRELYAVCTALSGIRREGAAKLKGEILLQLADLGMKEADFSVEFEPLCDLAQAEKSFTATGLDRLEFYLSANKGQPLKPLIKIISGGEASRFMLALKVISSATDAIPTMIFDEIDAGISGKVGQEVAKKLAAISRRHQVLCVTHLPQIASMGDNHYFISKSVSGDDTLTDVRLLDGAGMVEEISRLSGAKGISEESDKAAQDLKLWSDRYKSGLN